MLIMPFAFSLDDDDNDLLALFDMLVFNLKSDDAVHLMIFLIGLPIC